MLPATFLLPALLMNPTAPSAAPVIAEDDPAALRAGEIQRATGAPQVVYVNFSDGTTTLTKGGENAPLNRSSICAVSPYPAWKGDEARKQTLQKQMAEMLAPYNVVLAAKRPTQGPYTMMMVGPATSCSGGIAGVAPLDCDNRNPSNIAFDYGPQGDIRILAQELAHTFGLNHNDVACDVMGFSYTKMKCPSGEWGYKDADAPFIGGASCGQSHQNSAQELKRILGEWPTAVPHPDPMGDGAMCTTDEAAPTLAFAEPTDGAAVPRDFVVRADTSDDCGLPKSVRLELPSEGLTSEVTVPPFGWRLAGIPDQDKLEMVLTATDAAGHATTSRIFVKVGNGAAGNPGGMGGSGGSTGGPGSTGSSGGCAIGASGAAAPALLFSLAIAIGAIRRRRR